MFKEERLVLIWVIEFTRKKLEFVHGYGRRRCTWKKDMKCEMEWRNRREM